MFDQFGTEPGSPIAETDARFQDLRRKAQDRARYEEQVRMREMEIHLLHRAVQAADKNAYESHNLAPEANAELARAGLERSESHLG